MVKLSIQGWEPGLNKVQLTMTIRNGGVSLHSAVDLTGKLLVGEEIFLSLNQFDDFDIAKNILLDLGVSKVNQL